MLSTNQKGWVFFFNLLITAGFHQCQTLIISRHVNWPLGVVYLMLKVLDGVIQRNAITEVTSCLPLRQRGELRRLWVMRTCVLPFPSVELQNSSSWIPWLLPSTGDLLCLVLSTSVSALQACFLLHAQIPTVVIHIQLTESANRDIPGGCGSAVMLLLSKVKSAGRGLWCCRSGSRVLPWSVGIIVDEDEEGVRVFPKQIQIFTPRHWPSYSDQKEMRMKNHNVLGHCWDHRCPWERPYGTSSPWKQRCWDACLRVWSSLQGMCVQISLLHKPCHLFPL